MDHSIIKKNIQTKMVKLKVNLFLPGINYTCKKGDTNVRHHLYELYTKVFSCQDISIYPVKQFNNVLQNVLVNFFKIGSGKVNVVTQGYSVFSVYIASVLFHDMRIIVHTWKVPGFSDRGIGSYVYDYCLSRLIKKSFAVIVASKKQERQVNSLFHTAKTFFVPVTVDSNYWNFEKNNSYVLEKYNLKADGFLLTVGGNDRDEQKSIKVSELLGIPFVRVTINQSVVENIRSLEKALNTSKKAIILKNISDADLITLYHNAYVVFLPTITKTNPAGLSSLVEAMSCRAFVAAPRSLSKGYVSNRVTGMVFDEWQDCGVIVESLKGIDMNMRKTFQTNARNYAVDSLSAEVVATELKKKLISDNNGS
jgi:glycosyltransferase involved in cell wall biosynthesis